MVPRSSRPIVVVARNYTAVPDCHVIVSGTGRALAHFPIRMAKLLSRKAHSGSIVVVVVAVGVAAVIVVVVVVKVVAGDGGLPLFVA